MVRTWNEREDSGLQPVNALEGLLTRTEAAEAAASKHPVNRAWTVGLWIQSSGGRSKKGLEL